MCEHLHLQWFKYTCSILFIRIMHGWNLSNVNYSDIWSNIHISSNSLNVQAHCINYYNLINSATPLEANIILLFNTLPEKDAFLFISSHPNYHNSCHCSQCLVFSFHNLFFLSSFSSKLYVCVCIIFHLYFTIIF